MLLVHKNAALTFPVRSSSKTWQREDIVTLPAIKEPLQLATLHQDPLWQPLPDKEKKQNHYLAVSHKIFPN